MSTMTPARSALNYAQMALHDRGIPAFFNGAYQIQIVPVDGGGGALVRAIDDPARGVVLEVQDTGMQARAAEIFRDIVNDQAFRGGDDAQGSVEDRAKAVGAEMTDVLYVGVRAVQLLGRHS